MKAMGQVLLSPQTTFRLLFAHKKEGQDMYVCLHLETFFPLIWTHHLSSKIESEAT